MHVWLSRFIYGFLQSWTTISFMGGRKYYFQSRCFNRKIRMLFWWLKRLWSAKSVFSFVMRQTGPSILSLVTLNLWLSHPVSQIWTASKVEEGNNKSEDSTMSQGKRQRRRRRQRRSNCWAFNKTWKTNRRGGGGCTIGLLLLLLLYRYVRRARLEEE